MAISFLSCPFSSSPCGWPPLDSGHSTTQGFSFNMSDLWLRQPRQEFTQMSRKRGTSLIVLIELGKSHITFLNFSTCLIRTNKNLSARWEVTTVPASQTVDASGKRGELPLPPLLGPFTAYLCPRWLQLLQAASPSTTGQRQWLNRRESEQTVNEAREESGWKRIAGQDRP